MGSEGIGRRALIAAPLALAACGRARAPGTVTMWAMSTEGENAPRLIPAFERRTGLRVDIQSLPWTAAQEKMLTAYAGGSLPDLVMLSNAWLAEFAAIEAIAPMPADRVGLLADQFPAVAEQVRIGGRAWALPWVVGTQGQYYRRDMLAAAGYATPPADWAGWKAMLHAVKRRNPQGFAVLMLLNWPEHLIFFGGQQPDPMLRDRDSRGNFSSPGFRGVLAFYRSLFDEGLAPKVTSTEIADPLTLFANGWFAVYPAPPYATGDLRGRAPGFPTSLWTTAPMPGPDGLGRGVVGGNALAVTRRAHDPGHAWALAAYLCEPATEVRFQAITGELPSRPSAWAAPSIARDPVMAAFATQMRRTVAAPKVAEWERIQTEVQRIAARMVLGELTVVEAARAMDARADALLAKRRWLLERGRIA